MGIIQLSAICWFHVVVLAMMMMMIMMTHQIQESHKLVSPESLIRRLVNRGESYYFFLLTTKDDQSSPNSVFQLIIHIVRTVHRWPSNVAIN